MSLISDLCEGRGMLEAWGRSLLQSVRAESLTRQLFTDRSVKRAASRWTGTSDGPPVKPLVNRAQFEAGSEHVGP